MPLVERHTVAMVRARRYAPRIGGHFTAPGPSPSGRVRPLQAHHGVGAPCPLPFMIRQKKDLALLRMRHRASGIWREQTPMRPSRRDAGGLAAHRGKGKASPPLAPGEAVSGPFSSSVSTQPDG